MLNITSDLHTHTVFSHGTGTVEDNVRAAMAAGLKRVAITDHGFEHMFYSVRDVDAYLEEIRRVRDTYRGSIEVLSGAEFNLMSLDGDIDMPKGYEKEFNIVLMGYHKLVKYHGARNFLHFMTPMVGAKALARNTQAYVNAMERNKIDIITHPGYGIPIDKLEVARAAQKYGTALEVNAKHPEFTPEQLRACAQTGVLFSVGSDAHSPQNVGGFGPAIERAEEAGLTAAQIINAERGEQA